MLHSLIVGVPGLCKLDMRFNELDWASCEKVGEALGAATCCITSLNRLPLPQAIQTQAQVSADTQCGAALRWSLCGVLQECKYEAAFVVRVARQAGGLTDLDLGCNRLFASDSPAAQRRLIEQLCDLKHLRSVSLGLSDLPDPDAAASILLDALPLCTSFCGLPVGQLRGQAVEELRLGGASLGPLEAGLLSCLLQRFHQSRLASLDLSDNALAGDTVTQGRLVRAGSGGRHGAARWTPDQHVASINGVSGFTRLCSSLQARQRCNGSAAADHAVRAATIMSAPLGAGAPPSPHSGLTSIDLHSNFLGRQALAPLAGVVAAHPCLRLVNVANNCLGGLDSDDSSGWHKWCEALGCCRHLEQLDLSGNLLRSYGTRGLSALSHALRAPSRLRVLSLSQNGLDGRQVSLLLAAAGTSLESLRLGDGDHLSAPTHAATRDLLVHSPVHQALGLQADHLASLGLCANAMDKEGGPAVLRRVAACPRLLHLDFRGLRGQASAMADLGVSLVDLLKDRLAAPGPGRPACLGFGPVDAHADAGAPGGLCVSQIPMASLAAGSISSLDLSWSGLGPTECALLADALAGAGGGAGRLRRLLLTGNRLCGDGGLARLSEEGEGGISDPHVTSSAAAAFDELCNTLASLAPCDSDPFPGAGPRRVSPVMSPDQAGPARSSPTRGPLVPTPELTPTPLGPPLCPPADTVAEPASHWRWLPLVPGGEDVVGRQGGEGVGPHASGGAGDAGRSVPAAAAAAAAAAGPTAAIGGEEETRAAWPHGGRLVVLDMRANQVRERRTMRYFVYGLWLWVEG